MFKKLLIVALGLLTNLIYAQDNSHVVTKEGAWCWFADPRALHYENKDQTINKTFIGYIDIHGNIKASQYDFLIEESQEVLVRSWFQPDDHNNPTFLVLPDERVMIFYSRHTDEPCFYYRISEKPGDITDLGPEFKIPTRLNTTYPSPFVLSDDPNHFYLCWRGISWHPTIAKLSLPDAQGKVNVVWGPKQMVQSTAARPYAKYTSNGKDKIYMSYTTGHPDPTMPNYIYFNYIDINTLELKDINGQVLSNIDKELHSIAATQEYFQNYPEAVVDNSKLRDWLWQTVIDEEGHPVIAMVRINEDKSSHDYYYARWTGTKWQKMFLTNAGGHFHQSPDIELCYSAGMAIDDQNPNEVVCSVPVSGVHGKVYELVKYTIDNQGKVSQTDTLTRDSELNNVRPYIIPNRNETPFKLTWMNGRYYDWIVSKDRPLGFCTSILGDFDIKNESIALDKGLLKQNLFKNQTIKLSKANDFTIHLNAEIDTVNYAGTLLEAKEFKYGLDAESMKPYLKIGDDLIQSNNILGNSDGWQKAWRGTGGNWYKPVKYHSVYLTVVYSQGKLTTYINGLIDQVIDADLSQIKKIELGTLITNFTSCKTYNRRLNYTEISTLCGN